MDCKRFQKDMAFFRGERRLAARERTDLLTTNEARRLTT